MASMLAVFGVRYLLVMLFLPFSLLDKIINFRGAVGQARQIAPEGLAVLLILLGIAVELLMPWPFSPGPPTVPPGRLLSFVGHARLEQDCESHCRWAILRLNGAWQKSVFGADDAGFPMRKLASLGRSTELVTAVAVARRWSGRSTPVGIPIFTSACASGRRAPADEVPPPVHRT